jgi:hypothetical protein
VLLKWFSFTNALSASEESRAAAEAANTKAITCRGLPKGWFSAPSLRTITAPIAASMKLLMNQQPTMEKGMPLCNSARRCAGRAPIATTHQRDGGTSSSVAKRIALGGQRIETGLGGKVSARPSFAPAK